MTYFYLRVQFLILFCLATASVPVSAQKNMPGPVAPPEPNKSLQFIETKNRIGHEVQYEAAVRGGKLYLHPDKFTYAFYNHGDGHAHGTKAEEHKKGHITAEKKKPLGHAFSVKFIGANKAALKPSGPTHGVYNYYLGNDQSKWVSGAKGYRQIDYDNLYPGIDMRLHEQGGKLKYEFFLEKGANPALIKMKYEGAEKLEIKNGELVVTTSLNTVTEGRPFTYQIVNGVQQPVRCNFKVTGKEVSFELPDGYDQNLPLVIDPVLTYSTYSGSTVDNWGNTATFDSLGNIYSGGIIFGAGFPTTLGPFYDLIFNGTPLFSTDICIQKFNPNATGAASLIYVTYIGGSGNETPHSLIVNNNDELLMLGTTGSSNYPFSSQAYSQSFMGGPSVNPMPLGISGNSHPNGVDIVISKLNSNGTSLLASTFLGGTGNDGAMTTTNLLTKNYGDQFRGDIIVDDINNVYIASVTSSTNFPIVDGFQSSYGNGLTDGIVCMLTEDLSSLIWSTYIGGSAEDAAFSIQLASDNSVFVCGGTRSANFPASSGSHKPSYGGNGDGYIARISSTGDFLQRATFIGTPSYDQTYFVQLDNSDNVYVLGQTQGNYPVTPGTYSNPNSRQFIHKLDYNLTNTIFSTIFGSSNGRINISPTAFLVNECERIYVAGWGGEVNNGFVEGSTLGMPITPNASQPTTDSSDFYIMQLSQNATALDFATFLGAPNGSIFGAAEHVDGGTSRFDKKGNVYHAVCACRDNSEFPITPGAWSNTNPNLANGTNGCNNAAFKYSIPELAADFIPSLVPNGPRETETCDPGTFYFRRVHSGGVSYLWDFGDGNTSPLPGPLSHAYADSGMFVVTLTITDSSTCVITDMAVDTVYVLAATGSVSPDTIVCLPDAIQLEAYGGVSYLWSPAGNLSDPTDPMPIATPDTATVYTVQITNASGCVVTRTVTIGVVEEPDISQNLSICPGQSTQLTVSPGMQSYTWSPAAGLSSPFVPDPVASPDTTTTYTVVTDGGGACVYTKYVTVTVNPPPVIQMPSDTLVCFGDSVQLLVTGSPSYSYNWTTSPWLNDTTVQTPTAWPGITATYYVTASSSQNCSVTDSVTVSVVPDAAISTSGPFGICEGGSVQLQASESINFTFTWSPAAGLNDPNIYNPVATPDTTTIYTLTASLQGCVFTDSVLVTVNQMPQIQMAADTNVCGTNPVQLLVTGNGQYSYLWSPSAGLSDTLIASPLANPTVNTTYYLQASNGNCATTDSVEVTVTPTATIATTGPLALCTGDSVQLQALPALGYNYSWSPGSGLSDSTSSNPFAKPSAATTYFLTATASGCSFNSSIQINVNEYPQVIMPGDTTMCSGNSYTLAASGLPAYQYHWSPPNGLSDTLAMAPLATPSATTVYTLTTNNAGCATVQEITLEIIASPVADAGPPRTVCPDAEIKLSAAESAASSFDWFPETGLATPTERETDAQISAATTYYLTVTGTNGCVSKDSVFVDVYAVPELAATPELPQGIAPYPLSFTNQSTGGNSYFWDFGNGVTSEDQNPSVTYLQAGEFPVLLKTTYGDGCPLERVVATVSVVPPFVPNIITPNGDGVNDVFKATITNFPLHILIYNRYGKLIYENKDYNQDWGGDDMPEGVYYYHLETKDRGTYKGWLEIVR